MEFSACQLIGGKLVEKMLTFAFAARHSLQAIPTIFLLIPLDGGDRSGGSVSDGGLLFML